MSSMLKKPGAGAFKPKAPMARRRPAPNLSGQSTPAQESTPGPSQDAATPLTAAAEPTSRPDQPLSGASTDATPSTAPTASASSHRPPAAQSPPIQPQNSISQPASRPADGTAVVASPVAPSDDAGLIDTPPATTAAIDQSTISEQTNPSQPLDTTTSRQVEGQAPPPPPPTTSATSEPSSTSPETPPLPSSEATLIPSVENNDEPPGNEAHATSATTQPRQPAPCKPRKRKTAPTAGENEANAEEEERDPVVPLKKKRVPRKKKTAPAEGAENEEPLDPDLTADADPKSKAKSRAKVAKPRAPRKRKTAVTESGADTEGIAGTGTGTGSGSDAEGAAKPNKRRRPTRKRAATPEDAENLRIDPTTVTIGELTRDIKTGKRWKDGQKILEADLERKREAMRQRLIRQGLLQEGEPLPSDANSEAGAGDGSPAPRLPTPAAAAPTPRPPSPAPAFADMMMGGNGISIRVVDGQIVTNEDSMQYDRHAEADRLRGDIEVREENDFSKRVTQLTYMTRKTSKTSWPDEDTAKFYHGLRMFGTDFNTIAKMFGGARDRRQIKLKFNREERMNPDAVNRCLIGEKAIAMDLEAVGGSDGLEESKVIQDELARLREEREAETKRLEDEITAEAKRKRDELLGKRKGDTVGGKDNKGRHTHNHHDLDAADMADIVNGAFAEASRNKIGAEQQDANPGAKYGVGTDPDVIDETDLAGASGWSGGRGAARGRGARGGRRGGGKASVFASGFGL